MLTRWLAWLPVACLASLGTFETIPAASPDAAGWIEVLASDADPRARRFAAWKLGELRASDGLESLVTALEDDDDLVTRYASEALVSIGKPAVERLTESLRSRPRARSRAAGALARIGKPAAASLIGVLAESDDAVVRRITATALGEIGPAAADAIPHLASGLRRATSTGGGLPYATALGRIGKRALAPLIELLDVSEPPLVRELACRGLAALGVEARPAVDLLVTLLQDDASARVRFHAAIALGSIGPAAERAAPHLLTRVEEDVNASVRSYSALALGVIGVDRAGAVRLAEALVHDEPSVFQRSMQVVAELGPVGLAIWSNALSDEAAYVRSNAARALATLARDAAPAASSLANCLGDENAATADRCAAALEAIGPDAVPMLAAAFDDPRVRVRGLIVLTLGRIEPPTASALPTLIDALADDAVTVRQLASWSLGKIGPPAADAVPALIDALSDEAQVRRYAAWALGNIGPAAAAAEHALLSHEEAPDEQLRAEVLEALQKIRGLYEYPD